ncbi:hypothetical protein QTP88_022932 [Uroleucon formosanum]
MEATAGAETSIPTLSISEDDRRDPYDLPAHFVAYLNMGQLLATMGRCEEAESMLKLCSSLDGSHSKDPVNHETSRVSALVTLGKLHADRGSMWESASVDPCISQDWKNELFNLLVDYDARDIFNADETGLFYKCLPDSTLTFKNEKCHGGKNSKERITVMLAANMDGSQKLKPLMIGKFANPRYFKNVKSFPLIYRSNKKAWMTDVLFTE